MSEGRVSLQENAIKQHCKLLHLPTIGSGCARLAEQAERERQGYLDYLDALLTAELDEREQKAIARRIKEASFRRKDRRSRRWKSLISSKRRRSRQPRYVN